MCVFMFAFVSLKVMGINGHAYFLGLYLFITVSSCLHLQFRDEKQVCKHKKEMFSFKSIRLLMKYALNCIGATKYFSVKLAYTKAVVLLLQTYNLFVFNA